jgi:hypothetical protein
MMRITRGSIYMAGYRAKGLGNPPPDLGQQQFLPKIAGVVDFLQPNSSKSIRLVTFFDEW